MPCTKQHSATSERAQAQEGACTNAAWRTTAALAVRVHVPTYPGQTSQIMHAAPKSTSCITVFCFAAAVLEVSSRV